MKKKSVQKKGIIWIADDNESYCIVLKESLRAHRRLTVQRIFHSVREVTAALRNGEDAPAVLLLDIRMPGKSGIEGITELRALAPEMKIMMLTSYDEQEEIQESLTKGASGYLLKSSTAADIARAVEKVLEGGTPVDPMITKKILRLLISGSTPTGNNLRLSKREKEIIQLIAKGLSSDKTASTLKVSYHTVTSHLKNIYKKLNVHSRHTLVAKAYQEHLIGKP